MFESIKAMAKKEEICEECGHKDILVDAIIDGQIKRICHRCSIANSVILLKKPKDVKIENVPRRSVHEILEDMSGIKPTPIKKPSSKITLEDLRKRYEEMKEKRGQQKERQEQEKAEMKKEEKKNEEKVLDEKEFVRELENKNNESMEKEKINEGEKTNIDFSIQATKHTRIRDLLERMKRQEQKQSESTPIPKPKPEPIPQPNPEPSPNPETNKPKEKKEESTEEKI